MESARDAKERYFPTVREGCCAFQPTSSSFLDEMRFRGSRGRKGKEKGERARENAVVFFRVGRDMLIARGRAITAEKCSARGNYSGVPRRERETREKVRVHDFNILEKKSAQDLTCILACNFNFCDVSANFESRKRRREAPSFKERLLFAERRNSIRRVKDGLET